MTMEMEDLIDNMEILTKKLIKIEKFLQGVTVGMSILLAVNVVVLVRLMLG